METGRRTIPEAIMVEIVARLPFRSIARFKSVCKSWKSMIESSYFRRLFVSLHRNSSSSWSLMFQTNFSLSITEAMGFHRCETWDLPKSLGSYIMPFKPYPDLPTFSYSYLASSNGLIWIEVSIDNYKYKSFVGNPVLEQWVEIPPPPEPCLPTGLVTSVYEDGVVSSFKVVRTCHSSEDSDTYEWRVYVYSSETGTWSFKRLRSSHRLWYPECSFSMNLERMIYIWKRGIDSSNVLIAHDFYSHEEAYDQCRVIPLPLTDDTEYGIDVRCCLTTSGGDVIYIEILDRIMKVWRLNNNNNSESSEWLQEEIDMASVGFDVDCFPMAMNPVDTDIVYLWSQQHGCLVSGNLKTQKFIVLQESENCESSEGCYRKNVHDSKEYMERMYGSSRVFMLSPFVLPQWMDSVPTICQIDHPP